MLQKRKQGFTLIELLVVIAVIGMLASIVLVALGPARKRGRDAKRVSDIRQISLAMDLCYDDPTCGGVDQYQGISVDGNGRLSTPSIAGSSTTYLSPLPQDPGGGTIINCADGATGEMSAGPYCGYGSSAGPEYCIYARLSDGRFFAASEKGAQYMNSRPSSLQACP